jgi:large subunit ribosomal protein L18
MSNTNSRSSQRKIRHVRLRQRLSGNAERPRLAVFRSAKHIYAQAIDDGQGRTLASASTLDEEVKKSLKGYSGNKEAAKAVGKAIAQRLTQLGIAQAVFDRGGNRYHGRVQALADSAREAGLKI